MSFRLIVDNANLLLTALGLGAALDVGMLRRAPD
jgi:hypothetical protein